MNYSKSREDVFCISVTEAARLLGLYRNFDYELARRGEIQIIRFGKRMLVHKAKFEKMLRDSPESEVNGK